MGKAILVISYGVRRTDEIERSVAPVERAISKAFPQYTVERAFICPEGVEELKRMGEDARHYAEVIKSLCESRCGEIYIVPLILAPGVVYEGILGETFPLPVAKPLLEDEKDLLRIAAIYGDIAKCTGREVVLMGHGSTSAGDDCYVRLSKVLPEHVHLACRSGRLRLQDVLTRLLESGNRSILLMPLMLTAGRHARGEMAGDGPDSWKNILKSAGFDVEVRLEGMGSMPEIGRMFTEKAREIIC